MNVLLINMGPILFSGWAIVLLLPGCLGELQPALHFNQTTVGDNSSSAELRQYTCGTTTTVFVSKGYQGRFASPSYPNLYSGGADCLWTLTTSSDAQFTLICDPFSISCTGDYLLVSPSGDIAFKDTPNPVCGTGRLQVTSKANTIAIAFHSAYYTNGGGFSCVAQAQAPTTVLSTTIAPPSNCDCGIKGQNRVVGGQTAGVTEWPWQTLLADISPSGGGYQFCGATLISPYWVLTAAHCTYNRLAANIGVVVGQYNTLSLSSTSQVRKVSQIIQHPNFNRTTVNHDIALLRLDSPVSFSTAVRPVCLPTRFANYDFDKQIGVVTGWGTTSFGGTSSENLLEVSLPIISTANCRLNPIVGPKITDNMFCTYAENKDACQGDSGGPLNWIDPQTGRAYIVGITSFGIGCAKLNTPGIYTKVTNYFSWMQQYTGTICSV